MKTPRLDTKRLILREWIETDIQPFIDMNCDPDVMRYFPEHQTADESRAAIKRANALLQEKQFGLWAVEVKEWNEFIGFLGLAQPTFEAPFTPCTEIAWRLMKKAWGHGFATEGATRVLQYAFNELQLSEVVSFTATLNLPSIKVMERIGMSRSPEEDFDHPRVDEGHPLRRHVLYRKSK